MVIKFGDLVHNDMLNCYHIIIGGFKFGGETYMHAVEILADFDLAVERHAAQSPNILAIRCISFIYIQVI